MTIELQNQLQREMTDALALTDPSRRQDAVLTVLTHQSAALIDCQRKTSDRVKEIVEAQTAKENQKKGAKLAIGAIAAGASVFGSSSVIIIAKYIGSIL